MTSLAAAFEEQVALTPEAEALREHGRSTDYRSLNEAANRLARYLRRLGVGPETVVGLCLERSVEAVIGILGILKAGGAFLPLDPEHPRQRLEFMVDDSRALVIVTRSALAGVLERNGARLVCLDTERDAMAIAEESPLDLGLAAAPDQPAYAIYTSGSTGVPKGVVGTHRGTLNRLHWMWRRYPSSRARCARRRRPSPSWTRSRRSSVHCFGAFPGWSFPTTSARTRGFSSTPWPRQGCPVWSWCLRCSAPCSRLRRTRSCYPVCATGSRAGKR